MFTNNERDSYRRLFLEVYQKMQQQTVLTPLEAEIAKVLEAHPFYHHLLQNEKSLGQEFSMQGLENPFLHMGLHLSVCEQIQTDRPFGVRAIYQDLLKTGRDVHEVEHQMMEVLAQVLWTALENKKPPEEAFYLQQLRELIAVR